MIGNMLNLKLMLAAQTTSGSRLHFSGDISWWVVLLIAAGAVGFSTWIYRSDLEGRTVKGLWLLPLLRGGAVLLAVMMFAGPGIQHRTSIGTTARVLMYVDASASMKATDEQMEMSRKLRILRRLGWLEGAADEFHVEDALDQLGQLRRLLVTMAADTPNNLPQYVKEGEALAQQAAKFLETMKLDGWTKAQLNAFKKGVLIPFQKVNPDRADEDEKASLLALQPEVDLWEKKILGLNSKGASALEPIDEDTRAAVERFNRTPRWQRLESQLLGGADGLVSQLAAQHKVELLALTARRFQMLWHPGAIGGVGGENTEHTDDSEEDNSPPQTLPVAATNMVTDLSTGIVEGAVSEDPQEKLFVILFSDGQHNVEGTSPLTMAGQLKDRGIAVHVVGIGAIEATRDLAVLKVEAPSSVYPDAMLSGNIILHDGMDPGKPFTVRIEHEGRMVWERQFVTAGTRRKLPFVFPMENIVKLAQANQRRDIRYANLPLAFRVVIPPIPGESKDDNNVGTLRVNVVTQKPRIMLIDSRPRWEFRYLRNLLERDERWQVNTILGRWSGKKSFLGPRGNRVGQFPNTRDLLFQYQLIIIGDVSKDVFGPNELLWLKQFVQINGGGVIFIDGRVKRHSGFMGTPVYDLLPVKLGVGGQAEVRGLGTRLRFRGAGGAQGPLMLASDTAANLKIWNGLPGPRWVARSEALPGAETLLEVVNGKTVTPGLVFRRFGAGRVLYSAFDESWRWRLDVGDLYHQQYWNQISKWIMEPPFAVQDAYIALDSGPSTYEVEETARIRVRVTNFQLSQQKDLKPEAVIIRDGRVFGAVPLENDPESLTFRGETAPLEPGDYEVRVRIPGVPEEAIKASTAFTVSSNPFGELGRLSCDELLLRQIVKDSGGQYYREEDMHRLVDKLGPASDRREVVREIHLWQSYWWFVPIMVLLTAEWVLRRVKGLV